MSIDDREAPAERPLRERAAALLAHKNVLAGLMFVAIAILGLWISRDYPIGTALRMGTGYVPRLLCWALLGLGVLIALQGLREGRTAGQSAPPAAWDWRDASAAARRVILRLRGAVFVTASLVIFGLTIERLGLVISILLLTGVGAMAARGLRLLETFAAAAVLIALSWAIFIVGLGLTIPVWPEW
jgi:hypothetical protein